MDGTVGSGRYEFRVWGELEHVRARLASAARWCAEETIRDRYLLGPEASASAKLRHGTLEIKRLVAVHDGLQRWRPHCSCATPLPVRVVADLLTSVGADPSLASGSDSFVERDLVELFDRPGVLASVAVTKRRQRYRLGDVRCEATHVREEGTGASVWTVAVEHVDPELLADVRAALGLEGATNLSVNVALTEAAVSGRTGHDPAHVSDPVGPG